VGLLASCAPASGPTRFGQLRLTSSCFATITFASMHLAQVPNRLLRHRVKAAEVGCLAPPPQVPAEPPGRLSCTSVHPCFRGPPCSASFLISSNSHAVAWWSMCMVHSCKMACLLPWHHGMWVESRCGCNLSQVPDAVRFSVAPVELHPPDGQLPITAQGPKIAAHVRAGMNDQQLKVLSSLHQLHTFAH
jgi:hypothetical protein